MPDEQSIPHEPAPLEPALEDAQRLLRQSLTEVCATDPRQADTGEMIRLDEMLAIAGEAAKRAVSIRRRLRQEGRAVSTRSTTPRTPRRRGPADPPTGRGPKGKRTTPPEPHPAVPADMPPAATPPVVTTTVAGPAAAGQVPVDEAHRTFRDSHGVVWSVWAVYPQATRGRRAGLRGSYVQGWLTFVCEAEKRRLSPVPEGWTTLDDAALEQLCGSAEVARPEPQTRRMRPIEGDETTA